MYQTIDTLSAGRYFWDTLQRLHRMPFDVSQSDNPATLGSDAAPVVLVVVQADNLPDDQLQHFIVELRNRSNDSVLMAVHLDDELRFLNGTSIGNAIDEVNAADVLAMFAHEFDGLEWMRVGPEMEDDEEEMYA